MEPLDFLFLRIHASLVTKVLPLLLFAFAPDSRLTCKIGAGYVKKVGPRVTTAKAGDAVLLSFDYCSTCKAYDVEAPGYCTQFMPLNFTGKPKAFSAADENVSGGFFGQSSFAHLTVVKDNSAVNVTDLIRNEGELKMFAPLGCGLQTSAGTVTKLAGAGPKDVVAIVGLGGVGLAGIMVNAEYYP